MNLERYSGLDLIRAFAILFVLSVHFFLNTNFYTTPLIGKSLYFQTFLRMSFLICVPLFLILTGYLQSKKTLSYKYYKNLIPIIVIYLFYSTLSIIYKIFILDEHMGVKEIIASILNFTADGYSWYVNMYIGLFLLIPFLNIIYENLTSKNHKIILIFTLLFMTSLPSFLNGKVGGGILFVPDFWVQIYPITYYFLGCFIKENQFKINKIVGVVFFFVFTFIAAFLEIFHAEEELFPWIFSYQSLIVTAQSVVFFLIFYNVKIKMKIFSNVITLISILSLDIYLASYITDKIVYGFVLSNLFKSQQQILYLFFPIVFSTFFLAWILAFIRHKIINIR